MNYLFMVIFLMITPIAYASSGVDPVPAFDWVALLITLFGEHGQVIAAWVSVVLVIWSQVRQFIPPAWLAKLPNWLIDVLEFLAANKGKAGNESWNDPKHIKRVGT